MKAPRKPDSVAAGLSVPERVLLFCIASGTSWQTAGVTGETLTTMGAKGLIQRDTVAIAHGQGARCAPGAAQTALMVVVAAPWR